VHDAGCRLTLLLTQAIVERFLRKVFTCAEPSPVPASKPAITLSPLLRFSLSLFLLPVFPLRFLMTPVRVLVFAALLMAHLLNSL